jgi:hypothetical protein
MNQHVEANNRDRATVNLPQLVVGETYMLLCADVKISKPIMPDAICMAVDKNKALMMFYELWCGPWPGSGELSVMAEDYLGDLRDAICDVYLPQIAHNQKLSVYWEGAWTDEHDLKVRPVLEYLSRNYAPFGTVINHAWLGSGYDKNKAYAVDYDGGICGYYKFREYVCAPTFTLDLSKINVSNGVIMRSSI